MFDLIFFVFSYQYYGKIIGILFIIKSEKNELFTCKVWLYSKTFADIIKFKSLAVVAYHIFINWNKHSYLLTLLAHI